MSTDWSGPDTWVVLIDERGVGWRVIPENRHSVDAAVEKWISSGRTQDTLLDLTEVDGGELRILASIVQAFYMSTPELRRAGVQFRAFKEREEMEIRMDLGLWDATDE